MIPISTLPNINEILPSLKALMRIQDWDIEVKMLTGLEMAFQDGGDMYTDGLSVRDIRHSKATIFINQETKDDWYYILIHELLHVQSTMLKYTAESYFDCSHEYFDTVYEQHNDTLTRMFISLFPLPDTQC
jgi:hypothetical protein